MQPLTAFVFLALVYLSLGQSTTEVSTKPKPDNGQLITAQFKQLITEMKQLNNTNITGWDRLEARGCWPLRRLHKYRCIATIPSVDPFCKTNSRKCWRKSPLKVVIDVRLPDGKLELHHLTTEQSYVHYDAWSNLRDWLLGHASINCAFPGDKKNSSNCNVSIVG